MNEHTLVRIFEPLDRKKNHYTHARGKLSGVHIGVYQPWYSVLISNTWYK